MTYSSIQIHCLCQALFKDGIARRALQIQSGISCISIYSHILGFEPDIVRFKIVLSSYWEDDMRRLQRSNSCASFRAQNG